MLSFIDCFIAELFLDAEKLVGLGHPIGTGSRTGLDHPGVDSDSKIRDGGIFGFTRTMRNHGGITIGLSKTDGVESLG